MDVEREDQKIQMEKQKCQMEVNIKIIALSADLMKGRDKSW